MLWVVFVIEFCGYLIRKSHANNAWLYNLGYLINFGFYLVIYSKFEKKGYKLVSVLSAVYAIAWLSNLYISGIKIFFRIPMVVLSCSLVLLFSRVLFSEVMNFKGKLYFSPILFSCMGIIFNFGCLIPYFSLINLLNRSFPKESLDLLLKMLGFFNDLLYFSILISLFLQYIEVRKRAANE